MILKMKSHIKMSNEMTKEDILAWVEKELDVMKTTVCPCRKLLGFKHGWCDVMTY